MDLQRLPILRHGKGIFATDPITEQTYPVVNPGHVPPEAMDGIFSIDTIHRTAQFESRRASSPYLWGKRDILNAVNVPPTATSTLPDGTQHTHLLAGRVSVTMKGEECYVDAPDIPEVVMKMILAQALAGIDVTTAEYAKALQYVLGS